MSDVSVLHLPSDDEEKDEGVARQFNLGDELNIQVENSDSSSHSSPVKSSQYRRGAKQGATGESATPEGSRSH